MDNKKSIVTGIGSGLLFGSALIAAYFMAPHEGEKFFSYRDGGGVWTICRGHTKSVYEGMIATRQHCDKWYAEDIKDAEFIYDSLVRVQAPENTKAAMISFIFNAGAQNFARSTMLRKLNAGDIIGACNELPRWRFVAGRDCAIRSNNCYGIVTRRYQEKALCLGADI